jgi:hypothetical protein
MFIAARTAGRIRTSGLSDRAKATSDDRLLGVERIAWRGSERSGNYTVFALTLCALVPVVAQHV